MPFLPPEALADESSLAAAALRAVDLAKGGDSRSGLVLALQARSRAQDLEIGDGEARALNAAAIVHLMRRDAISAIAAAMDASELARRSGERSLLGHARVSLGMSAAMLHGGEHLARQIVACVEDAVAMGDTALEIRARAALGILKGDNGDFDGAAAELHRALALSRVHASVTSPSRILANIANLRRKQATALRQARSFAEAKRECVAAMALALEACAEAAMEGSVLVEIDALAISGSLQRLQGRLRAARALLRESIALARASRCGSAIAWVLCELGALELEADAFAAARQAYADALEVSVELRPNCKIATACLGLAEAEARAGNAEAAGRWLRRWASERDEYEKSRLRTQRTLEQLALAA